MASFFVYSFMNSCRPFYDGKGTAERVTKRDRNEHHGSFAMKLVCHRGVVLETPDEFETVSGRSGSSLSYACAHVHTRSALDVFCINHTVESEGHTSYRQTFSARERMSMFHLGMRHSERAHVNMSAHIGRVTSDSTRRKISDTLTCLHRHPGSIKCVAAAKCGRKQTHKNGFKGRKHHNNDVKKSVNETLRHRFAERHAGDAV